MYVHGERAARAAEVVGVNLRAVEGVAYLDVPGHERLAELALIVVAPGLGRVDGDGAVLVLNRARVGEVLDLGVLAVVDYLAGLPGRDGHDGVGAARPAAVVEPAVDDLLRALGRRGLLLFRGGALAGGRGFSREGEGAEEHGAAEEERHQGGEFAFHWVVTSLSGFFRNPAL